MDTINYSLKQKPKFFIMLASFNTFIDHQFASISGLRMGVTYNHRIRFGIGFHNLANNSVVSTIKIKENNSEYETDGRLNLGFVSFAAEYFFYNHYPWQCTFTPFNIGIGGANYEYISQAESVLKKTSTETVVIYQPEISAQYNVFKWFGVGVTTGYRMTFYRSQEQTKSLSAPTFAVDFRLFIDEIYKSIFQKEENAEKSDG